MLRHVCCAPPAGPGTPGGGCSLAPNGGPARASLQALTELLSEKQEARYGPQQRPTKAAALRLPPGTPATHVANVIDEHLQPPGPGSGISFAGSAWRDTSRAMISSWCAGLGTSAAAAHSPARLVAGRLLWRHTAAVGLPSRTLSSPTGPRLVFRMLATASTAVVFWLRTSWPEKRSPARRRQQHSGGRRRRGARLLRADPGTPGRLISWPRSWGGRRPAAVGRGMAKHWACHGFAAAAQQRQPSCPPPLCRLQVPLPQPDWLRAVGDEMEGGAAGIRGAEGKEVLQQ